MKTPNIENQLAELRKEYKSSLPGKIDEIISLWKKIQKDPTPAELDLFHRRVHSLHGAAGTFGFDAISDHTSKLENIANALISNPKVTKEQINTINGLIEQIKLAQNAEPSEKHPTSDTSHENMKQTVIYLFDEDNTWLNSLKLKMGKFGYQIYSFNNSSKLLEALQKQLPSILMINIHNISDEMHDFLKTKPQMAIIITATNGDFALRLQAVRLGGSAYLIKPFSTEFLIKNIEQILNSSHDRPRILIIDDETTPAKMISLTLEKVNMETHILTECKDIDWALHEFEPDLILTDIYMPDCNGLELAAIIRQQPTYNSIPILYLSAEEDKEKQHEALELGADDFISKSTKPEKMIKIIKNYLGRYKTLRASMMTDNLTGLYNHSHMLEKVETELNTSRRLHQTLCIAIIGIDKLKQINTNYGYHAGDQVLISLSILLKKRLRASDIIGRHSADFLIILPNTLPENAKKILDDLRKQFLSLNYSSNKQIFNATFSASIASFPEFISATELMSAAESALSLSKQMRKNNIIMVDKNVMTE